jgi:hypothetical protein
MILCIYDINQVFHSINLFSYLRFRFSDLLLNEVTKDLCNNMRHSSEWLLQFETVWEILRQEWKCSLVDQFFHCNCNTVKPWFIVSVGGPEKERWIQGNDRCGALYKMNKNCHICLCLFTESKNVHQWYYFHCQVYLHYLFLKKSLIHICLVAPFFFKQNNGLSILTMFAWSLMVMSWPYMNALIDWNNAEENKKQ